MFQEVRRESLQIILENSWAQRNFVLSNIDPPESLYANIPGNSFVLKRLDWSAAPYFSLSMISTNLLIENCFRVPFVTEMGRDALVVDIPVFNLGGRTEPKQSLRLCTTHLESLWGGKAYRPGQLGLISALLEGGPIMKPRIVAGLVGGT
jgi:tyrosyl-DNA phosphodiesterase 2